MAQLNLDLHIFFTKIRPVFGNMLTQGQVNGMQALISAWEASDQSDIRWLAYELATAKWETANAMQPIAEYGHGAGHAYGTIDMTGKAPYGRGYVQLTWRSNYVAADQRLLLNGALAANYDLALDPKIAAQILFVGMAEGWFTKRKLGDFINGTKCDYFNARTIINRLDHASNVATSAHDFEDALRAAITSDVMPVPPTPRPTYATALGRFLLELWSELRHLF